MKLQERCQRVGHLHVTCATFIVRKALRTELFSRIDVLMYPLPSHYLLPFILVHKRLNKQRKCRSYYFYFILPITENNRDWVRSRRRKAGVLLINNPPLLWSNPLLRLECSSVSQLSFPSITFYRWQYLTCYVGILVMKTANPRRWNCCP